MTINYNDQVGLEKTIRSVVSQHYADYEYIVIDGASTDGSPDIIRKYEDRISYWVSEPDNGIYQAMNKGIRKATGEYCLFLNAGDLLIQENILSDLFSASFDEDIVYGNVIKISSDQSRQNKGIAKSEISLYDLIVGRINHQAAFIKRNLFDQYGLYSEEYKIASDWKFFIDTIIVGNATVKYIDTDIAFFDVNGMSTTRPEEAHKETMQILQSTFPPRVLADIRELHRYKTSGFVQLYDQLIKNKSLSKLYNLIFHGKST